MHLIVTFIRFWEEHNSQPAGVSTNAMERSSLSELCVLARGDAFNLQSVLTQHAYRCFCRPRRPTLRFSPASGYLVPIRDRHSSWRRLSTSRVRPMPDRDSFRLQFGVVFHAPSSGRPMVSRGKDL
jgi:hypothetical protein